MRIPTISGQIWIKVKSQFRCAIIYLQFLQLDISNTESVVFFIMYSITMVMEIYFQCSFGAHLLSKSNRLDERVFHSNWIGQNQQFKQFLLIFGQGTEKPVEIFAGGLFRVDLTTFLRVSCK